MNVFPYTCNNNFFKKPLECKLKTNRKLSIKACKIQSRRDMGRNETTLQLLHHFGTTYMIYILKT